MAIADTDSLLAFMPLVKKSPGSNVWLSYDKEADVLYVNYERPIRATDSELTEDDVIVRKRGRNVIGYTVLHASRRRSNGRGRRGSQ